jgi:molybdenum cofactor biosynthesis enzyme
MANLSHLDDSHQPRMVDVSAKTETTRVATATCLVTLGRELLSQMDDGELRNKKGPVLQTAILAWNHRDQKDLRSDSTLSPDCPRLRQNRDYAAQLTSHSSSQRPPKRLLEPVSKWRLLPEPP